MFQASSINKMISVCIVMKSQKGMSIRPMVAVIFNDWCQTKVLSNLLMVEILMLIETLQKCE